jgi:hypothetical protein
MLPMMTSFSQHKDGRDVLAARPRIREMAGARRSSAERGALSRIAAAARTDLACPSMGGIASAGHAPPRSRHELKGPNKL